MEHSKKSLDNSMIEFRSALKETNVFKQLDHEENMKKVRKGQSAYKQLLVDRIMEKSNRGKDISDRKVKISDMAMHNSQLIRDQY